MERAMDFKFNMDDGVLMRNVSYIFLQAKAFKKYNNIQYTFVYFS